MGQRTWSAPHCGSAAALGASPGRNESGCGASAVPAERVGRSFAGGYCSSTCACEFHYKWHRLSLEMTPESCPCVLLSWAPEALGICYWTQMAEKSAAAPAMRIGRSFAGGYCSSTCACMWHSYLRPPVPQDGKLLSPHKCPNRWLMYLEAPKKVGWDSRLDNIFSRGYYLMTPGSCSFCSYCYPQ